MTTLNNSRQLTFQEFEKLCHRYVDDYSLKQISAMTKIPYSQLLNISSRPQRLHENTLQLIERHFFNEAFIRGWIRFDKNTGDYYIRSQLKEVA
jgi:predicted AAA+ superfamily ATPase